ncbi:MAG: inositol monophosphatase family protein [Planctomycetota bacterium]
MTDATVRALILALDDALAPVFRWSGAIARRLRSFDISLEHKQSGNAAADALTITDLTVQELIIAALRDGDPILRTLVIRGEEAVGDLAPFASAGEYTLAIDPIDGTKQYRDRKGSGYSIIVTLQSRANVEYSLLSIPEEGEHGSWLRIDRAGVRVGADDPRVSARARLSALPPVDASSLPPTERFFVNGFQGRRRACIARARELGLEGVRSEELEGCIFSLLAAGAYGGVLASNPNIYDFPVSIHLARALGGDAIWVESGEPVHFGATRYDEGTKMFRLSGIVAASRDRALLERLRVLGLEMSRAS